MIINTNTKGYAFIDIKTTGFNPVLDKICYIAITHYDSTMRPKQTYSTWINPECPLTETSRRLYGVTHQDLQEYPTFAQIVDIIEPMITGKVLGSFTAEVDTIEFLREELFMEGIKLKYRKADFIIIKNLEEVINKRDLASLYYKYTGVKLKDNEEYTKEMGDIFRYQCDLLDEDPRSFNYSKYSKNNFIEYSDKYLLEIGDKLYFNFGKFKDEDVAKVKEGYIEFIMESDFPIIVKQKIKDYLE